MTTRLIDRLTTGGVLFLTVASFVLSYDALRQLALLAGVPWSLSWLYPFTLDAVIIVSAVSTLRMTTRQDSTGYAWFLVVSFTLLSIAGNVLHLDTGAAWYVAYVRPWLSYVVFAVPPVALALSFHLLIVQVKNDIRRQGVTPKPDNVLTKPDSVTPGPDSAGQEADSAMTAQDRKRTARQLAAEGVSRDDIAETIGVTPRTVARYLNGKGK